VEGVSAPGRAVRRRRILPALAATLVCPAEQPAGEALGGGCRRSRSRSDLSNSYVAVAQPCRTVQVAAAATVQFTSPMVSWPPWSSRRGREGGTAYRDTGRAATPCDSPRVLRGDARLA
jgi:hypothetical protein